MSNENIVKYSLFFLLGFGSCNAQFERSDIVTIDIESGGENRVALTLSQYADSVWYIQMEGGNISLKNLRFLDKREHLIVVSDMIEVALFDDQGTFLAKIGTRGRGPGEYIYATNCKLSFNGTILVQNLYDLLEYDINGRHLASYKNIFKPDSYNGYSNEWVQVDDSLFLMHLPIILGDEEYRAVIKDRQGSFVQYIKNYNHFKNDIKASDDWSDAASVYMFNQRTFYHEMLIDTLYELDKSYSLVPRFHFNRGKYYISYTEIVNSILDHTFGGLPKAYIEVVFETQKHLFLDILFHLDELRYPEVVYENGVPTRFVASKLLGIYDKNSDHFLVADVNREGEYTIRRTGLINDIDGGFSFYPTARFGDNTLAMQIDALKLKRYVDSDGFRETLALYPAKKRALEELANSLTEESNPVLMVVRMK
jgi:hypothetical protein